MNSFQTGTERVVDKQLIYISESDVAGLDLTATQCCEVMREVFSAQAADETVALPATHLDIAPGRGFRSLCAAWPAAGLAGNKWFGVRPTQPGDRGSGVQALYLLNDYVTGSPLAIISANQLTGLRTAAMSALVLQALRVTQCQTIGFIGCGLQASFHLKLIHSLVPALTNVRCYSRTRKSAEIVAAQATSSGLASEVCQLPEDAVKSSQIVVSSIPLSSELVPFLDPDWIQPGSILLAVDLARPWHTEDLHRFELKITDDHKQQAALPPISSKLGPIGTFDADLTDIATGKIKPFNNKKDRVVFAFRGFSLADLAIAKLLYESATTQAVGQRLAR